MPGDLFFCLPKYAPDPGHEDKQVHSNSTSTQFFAIVAKQWRGVVTTEQTFKQMLICFPDARTFTASTWTALIDKWNEDCENNHHHDLEDSMSAIPGSDAPSSAPHPIMPSPLPPPHSPIKSKPRRAVASPKKMETVVLQLPSTPQPVTKLRIFPLTSPRGTSPSSTRTADPASLSSTHANHASAYVAAMFETLHGSKEATAADKRDTDVVVAAPSLMYGVTGHNRVFRDRGRALAALKNTSGGELVFTYDENVIWEFVEAEAQRMAQKGVQYNPHRAVQQPCQRGKSNAADASNALRTAQRLQKRNELDAELMEFQKARLEKTVYLASKYSRSPKYISSLLMCTTRYKTTRKPNLRNAVIHDTCMRARETGDTSELPDQPIKLSKSEYEDIKDGLSTADKARLIKQLTAYRELKHRGIRATNKSLAMDARESANRMGDVLVDLFERTGVRSVAIFSRGSAEDTAAPHLIDSDGAHAFFQQVFGFSSTDLLRKFEQWSCTQDEGSKDKNDLGSVQKQIVLLLLAGLRMIKNNKTLAMEYVNYRRDIVHKLGVHLVGWPSETPMRSPANLTAMQAREIRDGLRSGSIAWAKLSAGQRAEVAAEIAGGPSSTRKTRKDKGITRLRGEEDSDSNSDSDSGKDEGDEEGSGEEDDVDWEDVPGTAPLCTQAAPFSSARPSASTSRIPASTVALDTVDSHALRTLIPFDPLALDPSALDVGGLQMDYTGLAHGFGDSLGYPFSSGGVSGSLADDGALTAYLNAPSIEPFDEALYASTFPNSSSIRPIRPFDDASSFRTMPVGSFDPGQYTPNTFSESVVNGPGLSYSGGKSFDAAGMPAAAGDAELSAALLLPPPAVFSVSTNREGARNKRKRDEGGEGTTGTKRVRTSASDGATLAVDSVATKAPRKKRIDAGKKRKAATEISDNGEVHPPVTQKKVRKTRSDAGKKRKTQA
ncbi:hypothetical protein DFH06DRAFT_1324498 [Mycena polygramma]|nr:hypothetical protein DFH06DRAFT_1324498 [Mycena polygramma]